MTKLADMTLKNPDSTFLISFFLTMLKTSVDAYSKIISINLINIYEFATLIIGHLNIS